LSSRRHFLKTSSALSFVAFAPAVTKLVTHSAPVHAAQLETADFRLPARLPQVINVFLYGGASELAGNLTNIEHISAVSQNPYPQELLQAANAEAGQYTANGMWRAAGGDFIENMVKRGDMSVYRTINRRKHNSRAHRQSIFSSQKGSLGIDTAGGMGSTIAAVLVANRQILDGSDLLNGKTLDELVLPFVSFEGTSIAFAPESRYQLPLGLRGLSLHENFDNPYSRDNDDNNAELEALVRQVESNVGNARFSKIRNGFMLRRNMEELIGNLQGSLDDPMPLVPLDELADSIDPATGEAPGVDIETGRLRYPQDNSFAMRIKAAVTLAINNSDTKFIAVGGGLQGWDDHDSAMAEYVPRMRSLMESIDVAMKHIRYSGSEYGGARDTSNIIINVHGDFGRNVNLNNSMGWDHGNNQSFYTLGGRNLRPSGALGKIVGSTDITGSAEQNRLFTVPANGSYEAEPMSIAASTYRYFGVQNPRALTHDSQYNPDGDDALDETVPGVPMV